ncbi:small fragment nuclease isoform X1 [Pseudochaenichthys georgianus]|uniref:small fragment nuclease isoform X1 n=1 Tax=Pseudochaenichthys georgianus TaxID=52239 RepID=UPI00146CB8D9|nr:small fragment nuclease isoform X1 [Pseudochaenichthys georgianus]
MMLVLSRTSSAWAPVILEFVCQNRAPVLRQITAGCHSHCRLVLQRNAPVSRGINTFTSRFVLSSDVQLSRKISMSSNAMSQRMVWVDLEMTGLDIEKDQIIEMACLITDSELNIVAEGPNLIINQPKALLDGMSEWCVEHHGESGLTQAVQDSKITLEQAEYEFLSFVRQHTPPGQCPLAGNSVHADKRFLDKFMPQFMFHLHYRIIDVSTIKELCRRWYPKEYKMVPHKKAAHRALDDIQESIKELKFYRANVFKPSEDKKCKTSENGGGCSNSCHT